jgi:DNA-binding PadR family transcriptional regulator
LTPAVFEILLALADDDRHGYGIAQEVRGRTDGRVRLGPGTLYGTIGRMLDAGLIEERTKSRGGGDERRRYYGLTPFGREVARAEARRIVRLAENARAKALVAPKR